MKKLLAGLLLSFVLVQQVNATNVAVPPAPILGLVKAAVKKAIKAIDLKIQRLQNKTIWLQNTQKEIEKMEREKKKSYRFIITLNELLTPLHAKLESIDKALKSHGSAPKYYRNEDLKRIFGLSNNTIIKYRQTGILPYTKIGDIFLYDSKKIEKMLHENQGY